MPAEGDQWCSAGTPNVGAAAQIVLDFAFLVIPGLDIPAAFELITSAIGVTVFATSALCSDPPRYPGDPTFQDLIDWGNNQHHDAIRAKYLQLLIYYAWPSFCTCTTFVSPITVYPPPPVFPGSPPALPSQSTPLDLTCNLSDVSSKLNAILGLLNLILATVGPQSYTIGASHTVTGTGELSISGLVGVLTHAISYAPGVGYNINDPVRYFDTGYVAFGDANGWYRHRPIIHDPQFHLVDTSGMTRVGYDAGMATSLEITELLPHVIYQGN